MAMWNAGRGDEVLMEPGEYIVMTQVHKSDHHRLPRPVVISAYCEHGNLAAGSSERRHEREGTLQRVSFILTYYYHIWTYNPRFYSLPR